MAVLVKIILSLSLSGTLLLLSVLVLKHFYKNIFSRCWQYYILLLAALKFLIPVFFNYDITGYLYKKAVNITGLENVADKNIADVENIKEAEKETKELKEKQEKTKELAEEPEEKKKAEETKKAVLIKKVKDTYADILNRIRQNIKGFYKYFFYIWFLPAVVLLIYKITVYQRFMVYIKDTGDFIQDIGVLNILAECKEKLGIKKAVKLYLSPLVSSPVLAGFLCPYIIIPAKHIEDEKLFYVFLHELAHYKRKDIFYKWFVQVIICIHWFNPFIYLLGREVNKACELSCDEAVIAVLGQNERREYGNTLLSFIQTKETYKKPFGMVTLSEGAKQLKERLGAIMYYKKKSVVVKIATVIITLVICFNFWLAGAYVSGNSISSGNGVFNQEEKTSKNKSNIQDTGLKELSNFKKYYRQRSFYINPYIFEIGWDLREDRTGLYNYKAKVELEDSSKLTVYFDDNVGKYCKDKNVVKAAGKLIDYIKKKYTVINIPLIMRVTYVKTADIEKYAEKYYKNGDLIGFIVLFPELSKKEKSKYLDKMYGSGNIAYFTSVSKNMDRDLLLTYLDKSSKGSENVDFFLVLLDYAEYEDIKYYIKKSYKSGDTTRFAILSNYLSVKDKKKWRKKAKKEQKMEFYILLSDKL